jgi:hypothetical protein
MRHFMGDEGKVFDLIVQRSVVTGQVELDLDLDLDLDFGIKISAGHLLSAKVIF